MCGIFFCYCCSSKDPVQIEEDDKQYDNTRLETKTCTTVIHDLLRDSTLEHRGPNVSKQYRLPFSSECLNGWMRGCVLHLRGELTPQPLVDDKGNALLWNAEIFDGIEVSREENDTQVLFNHLTECETDEDVLKTLERVRGPWAVIFWQAKRNVLWFGRDVYGRRSLLWHLPSEPSELLALTSVAVGDLNYTEIPSVGIFALDFTTVNNASSECWSQPKPPLPSITLYPWYQCKWPGSAQPVMETKEEELASFLTPNQTPSVISIKVDRKQILKHWMPDMSKTISDGNDDASVMEQIAGDKNEIVACLDKIAKKNGTLTSLSEDLIAVLLEAVEKRVNCLPLEQQSYSGSDDPNVTKAKIAVLFSGGLDSSVIAALLDRCLPSDEPIDLLNVAFEQPPPAQNRTKSKHKKHRKNEKDKSRSELHKIENGHVDSLYDDNTPNSTKELKENLETQQNVWSTPVSPVAAPDSSSTFGASAASTSLCEDSFNLKCQVKDTTTTPNSKDDTVDYDPYDVPDRRTGRLALSELNPNRKWNFIEINISQKELQILRSSCIGKLIYPLQTVLDDSIGCAVWFAARGRGTLATSKAHYVISKAKVILCGMAADEQFAGYSRHRAHFHQWGEQSLVNQLEQEMWRISSRNLGRDDRIIADHGKEARFPFLDENVTEYISKIPVYLRANLHLPRGLGEKLLLRLSALSLGLKQTACQPKRAIQFGSKIAKLDNSKEKGSDICQRLL